MGLSSIVEKLNQTFSEADVDERQVVYILVETRKLLEQQNSLNSFPTLRLCSDWAVHPKLDRSGAKTVLSFFDAYEAEYRQSGLTIAEFNHQPLLDFMTHRKFREEFIQAIEPHDVCIDRLTCDAYWRAFVQQYSEVVRDCPLEAQLNTTQFVNHVTCLAWPEDRADALYPGKHVIQWNWNLKSGVIREKVVCALI